jgi:hypothetical protein
VELERLDVPIELERLDVPVELERLDGLVLRDRLDVLLELERVEALLGPDERRRVAVPLVPDRLGGLYERDDAVRLERGLPGRESTENVTVLEPLLAVLVRVAGLACASARSA